MISAYAQNLKPVAEKVQNYQNTGKTISKVILFTVDPSNQKQNMYEVAAKGITVMQVDKSEITKIISQKPEALEFSFPFEGREVTVQLLKNNLFADGFRVNTDKGYVEYTPGVYYNGIVKGDNTSVVAFSFFKDDVVGITSILNTGNIVVGKATNSEDFVSYNDKKLNKGNPFVCGVEELAENHKQKISYNPAKSGANKLTTNCVRIYFEAAYTTFTNNSSNTTATTNYVTAMFNNIKTLYNNDNINVALSEVFVWTTPDPYTGTSTSARLSQFRSNRQTFNGDEAQLIKILTQVGGGIAYLNSLCTTNKHSYVDIYKAYANVPTFSWNIEAMTHELGHSLGSPHTHACNWNGNDTAIDGCGPAAGYSEGCDAPVPADGTIMSYCHLTLAGINFALGFGPQPGALIRETVESRGCLGTNCTTSCTVTVTGLATSNVTTNSVTATITDNVSTSWKYEVAKFDGTVVATGTTSTKTFTVNNLQEGTYYKVRVGTECSGPSAFNREATILTDADWCSGIHFTDTGGPTANYEDSQLIIKTFYPSSSDQKLKITFTQFELEDGSDFMIIYDGINVAAPRLATNLTGNTIPGPYQATNAQGAITVRFSSDAGLRLAGWDSTFECITLATSENSVNAGISVSPNPTKGMIRISAADKLVSYEIFDASGRMVSKSTKDLNSKSESVDLSKNANGTYMVTVKTAKETVTKKVIKY